MIGEQKSSGRHVVGRWLTDVRRPVDGRLAGSWQYDLRESEMAAGNPVVASLVAVGRRLAGGLVARSPRGVSSCQANGQFGKNCD